MRNVRPECLAWVSRSIVAALSLVPLLALPAKAACPENFFILNAQTVGASAETRGAFDQGQQYPIVHGAYDLAAGTLSANVYSADGSVSLQTVVTDEYTVVGFPDGTPVAFGATIRLNGGTIRTCHPFSGCGSGEFAAAIFEPGTANADSTVLTSLGERVVRIPIAATAGTPFRLEFKVRATGNGFASSEGWQGGANVTALIHFPDLPPNATIVSCQGFVPAVVGVRAASWGALKILYR